MKKAFILSLAFALSFSLMQSKTIQADEFSGKEDEYISLCSSATLTKSKEKVCKRFNKYLKDKTSNLKVASITARLISIRQAITLKRLTRKLKNLLIVLQNY